TIDRVANPEASAQTELPRRWLAVARVAWLAAVLPTIVLFALGLVLGFGQLRAICTGAVCHPEQLSPEQAVLNQQLGLSLEFYAGYTTFVFAAFGLIFFSVAVLVFWRRSRDRIALLLSFFLVLNGAGALPVIQSVGLIQPHLSGMGSLMFQLSVGLWP